MALFGMATRDRTGPERWIEPVSRPPLGRARRWLAAAALILGVLSMLCYACRLLPERWLVAGWLAAQAGWLGAFLGGLPRVRGISVRAAAEVLSVAAVLLVAAWARLWENSVIPLHLHGDMASYGLQARALLTGSYSDFFGSGWALIPLIGYWPTALSLQLFGDNLAGLNTMPALFGVSSLLGLYLLARELFGWRIALLALILATGDLHHLHYSRLTAFMEPVVIVTWGVFFFIRGLRHGWPWEFAAAGLLAGYSLLTYYSGRILVPLLIVLVLLCALAAPRALRNRRWGLAVAVVGFVLAVGPHLVFIARAPDAFAHRTKAVSIFSPGAWTHAAHVYRLPESDTVGIMVEQARRAASGFWQYNDTSSHFGIERNWLNSLGGTLLLLGLGYALARARRLTFLVLLAWMAGYALSAALTVDPPASMRILGIILPLAILTANALDAILRLIIPRSSLAAIAIIIGMAVATASGVHNWNDYLVWATNPRSAGPPVQMARFLMEQPEGHEGRIVSTSFGWNNRELAFLLPGRSGATLRPDVLASSQVDWPTGPAIFILAPEAQQLAPALQERYPDGRLVDGSLPPLKNVFLAFFTQVPAGECCAPTLGRHEPEPSQTLGEAARPPN